MSEERWLVKSSGRVLGPFSLEELGQHLRARTLSIIDEVRDPVVRWGFIREHPMLKEIVKQLRAEDQSHSDATQSTFVGRTMTASVTETAATEREVTPNPGMVSSNYLSGQKGERPINARERNLSGGARAYGSLNDQRFQNKIAKKRRVVKNILWSIACLFILSAIGTFYYQKHQRQIAQGQANQWLQVAHEQNRFGQTAKALEFLNKANQGMHLTAEDQILRAELLLQVEGKSNDALRILSEIKNLQDPRLIREYGLAKALVFMKDQRWNEAAVEINTLFGLNPNDEEARLNQALIEFYQGRIVTSMQMLNSLVESGYKNGQILILKSWLALSWPSKNDRAAKMNLVADEIKKNVETDFELHFEKNLMLANLRLQEGKKDEALKAMSAMWNADPFDSRNFMQPLTVDSQIISWDRLYPICEGLTKTFSSQEPSFALDSICLYQRGETSQALQKIDERRRQLSQSPLLASVQALLYLNVGRGTEARTLGQFTQDEILGQLVIAQLCQSERDWNCAEQAWGKVLASVPSNPMAAYGMAVVAKQRGNENLMREQLRKAAIMSPRYRPFLETRGEANGF